MKQKNKKKMKSPDNPIYGNRMNEDFLKPKVKLSQRDKALQERYNKLRNK